jgi:ribosomal protein L11 methyltransferase
MSNASIDRLDDTDWVALTQRQFEPIRAGRRLWIVPTWHEPPQPGDVNVALDPGAAFGTGSHPTTRMCLAWLEENVRAGDSVLDYGCGSGILAIAALKLGAARATGVDVDRLALEAARYHSSRNGVDLEVRDAAADPAHRDDHRGQHPRNPLRMLAPLIAAHTRAGGRIALGHPRGAGPRGRRGLPAVCGAGSAARESGWVLLAGRG